ncbi:MAG: YihY/virulence factor BrkB family protein [Gammaproteobacteria bacterium]
MAMQLTQLRHFYVQSRRTINNFLWHQQISQLPWWRRTLVRSCQITVAIGRDLTQEQLSLRAMSLVFTTVIGFFPLFALIFSVLKGLGAHNAMEPTLLALLEPLGERSTEVTSQILGYVDNLQVELIGITSIGMLLYIVIDMMRKIEAAFNYIWTVKQGRSWSSRISEYLFAVIVSPLLLFISVSITSYVNTNFFTAFLDDLAYGTVIIQFTAGLAPILLMSLAFAFAYGFLPNTRVQFGSAFIGGLVTTIIWKLMGTLFQEFFVTSARESLYLAFASAIIIMFFIYFGWLVALIGSSIAFYHQNPAKTRTGREKLQLSASQSERLSLAVAATIIERFNAGDRALTEEQLIESLDSNPMAIESAIISLLNIGLITATSDDPARFLPAHSIADCTLYEIWKALREADSDLISTSGESRELHLIKEFQDKLDTTIERELGDIKFVDVVKN